MTVEAGSVSIIIPALNEEAAIGKVVGEIVKAFPKAEVIVVNDGSRDKTAEKAAQVGAKVLSHDKPHGYGAALRTGTENASRPYILFCDGDGQHSVKDVRRIIEACEGYDMVVGARERGSHAPLLRRPGKLLLRWFANFLAGEKIPDLNSGLRIYKHDVLMRYIHLMPKGFSFSTTGTFAMLKSNRRIKYIPIKAGERIGTSTVRQWRHGPQTLMLMLRLTVLFEPLKVFLSVAAGLFLLCLTSFIIDMILARGGVSDTTVTLAISSLMVFMFGLLCDQVSALRREKHE
jgi:glycosyltransferase involved in cell wall biosynthesis